MTTVSVTVNGSVMYEAFHAETGGTGDFIDHFAFLTRSTVLHDKCRYSSNSNKRFATLPVHSSLRSASQLVDAL
jgi:hypothetical protein